jgi:hypothetical protein
MPWFAFTDASKETFVFRLTDPARIAEARAILSGAVTDATHVAGTVVKQPAPSNIGWSFHLDPASIFLRWAAPSFRAPSGPAGPRN